MPGAPGTLSVEIAGQRLDVDDLVRADAEIFDDLGEADAPLLAGACDAASPEAGSYIATPGSMSCMRSLSAETIEHVGAALARLAGIGGDEVVGLVAALLDRDHAEGAHGRAHQRELRHEFVGRVLPVRLVGGVDVAPERVLRLVEDHREMGRLDARRARRG